MNKAELIKRTAEIADMKQKDISIMLEAMNEAITEALMDGDTVKTGLFTHSVKDTKPRVGHNPKTGEKIQIEASKRVISKATLPLTRIIKGE